MSTPQDPFATPPQGGATPPTPPSAPPPSGPAWGAPAPGAPAPDVPGPGGYGSGYGTPAPPGGYGAPGHPRGTSNGMSIAALVLGLLGLFLAFFVIGGLLGVIAIVLGVLALGKVKRGEASGKGMPIAGIVLGVLSVLIAGAVIALGAWFVSSDAGQDLADCLDEAAGDPVAEAECERELEDSLGG